MKNKFIAAFLFTLSICTTAFANQLECSPGESVDLKITCKKKITHGAWLRLKVDLGCNSFVLSEDVPFEDHMNVIKGRASLHSRGFNYLNIEMVSENQGPMLLKVARTLEGDSSLLISKNSGNTQPLDCELR